MSASPLTPRQRDARALARSRREAMLRRARRIRRAVSALAVTLFATAFLIVYVQLASGHDPALLANEAKRRAASTSVSAGESSSSEASTTQSAAGSDDSSSEAESASSTESESEPESEASESEASSSSGSEESSSGAAVTTSQS